VTTVRSEEKADKIRSIHPNVGADKLSFAIVPDIAKEGAFDEAVKSDPPFEAVIHTASPFHFNVKDVQKELLDPAIIGTTGLLKTVAKNAPTVKRVVITSSFAAIRNANKGNWPEHTYSEEDWNPITHEQALEGPAPGYSASKKFAEKAAWEFVEREKPDFDIATMCPPYVFGPIEPVLQTNLESLNTSNTLISSAILGKFKDGIPPTNAFLWIDVRDLALGHVLAVEKADAGNKRFFFTAGHFSNKQVVDVVRKNFPEYKDQLPSENEKGGDLPEGGLYGVNNNRVKELLGKGFYEFEQTVVDTIKTLKKIGA
jgi:nucleoside-diphosphate-sugar epimerase